jgi:hypothetical protein
MTAAAVSGYLLQPAMAAAAPEAAAIGRCVCGKSSNWLCGSIGEAAVVVAVMQAAAGTAITSTATLHWL